MTQRLLVHIDETWPANRAASWVVLDDRDRVLQQGQSEPAHWPAADDCEVVLSAPQCSWLETRIPKAAKKEQDRLLRYALEPLLIRDIDEQHLTVTHQRQADDGINAGVLIVSRNRLRAIVALLSEIARPPSRIVSELQAAPAMESGWTLTLAPAGYGILRTAPTCAIATDQSQLVPVIRHALERSTADGTQPGIVEVFQPGGTSLVDLQQLGHDTGLTFKQAAPYRWWQAAGRCTDLLHGEFAPLHSGRKGLRQFRSPLLFLLATFVLFLVVNLGHLLWQEHQLGTIEERMQRLLATALPNTPAIAPALQLHRHLDERRSLHGQLRENDFLSLLLAYSEIRGSSAQNSVRKLTYAADRLELQLLPDSAGELATLRTRFAKLGYVAETPAGNMATLTISRPTAQ